MLRPNSQPLTDFEPAGRLRIPSYYHTPFLHDRSVSCEQSLARYGVLLAASHSTRERIVSRLDFDTRLQ